MSSFTLEQAPLALRAFFECLDMGKDYWPERYSQIEAEEHPFGLEINLKRRRDNKTVFMPAEGGTQFSTRGILLMLQHELTKYGLEDAMFRLRIIRAQVSVGNPSRRAHDLYFELITTAGSFLYGDCTDYSGEGGRGGKDLEAVFGFIGIIYDLPVEEVVLTPAQYKKGKERINNAYVEHEKAA